MDMYKVKWTQLQAEIFRLLCTKAGSSLNLNKSNTKFVSRKTLMNKLIAQPLNIIFTKLL